MSKKATDRNHWLWVTRSTYYLDADGNEHEQLDPSTGIDSGDWWTCHRDTRKGDLALLYRTKPKRDIRYLIQAASDSYSITDDKYAVKQGWVYGCDYEVLYKFENPITRSDIGETPYLRDWGAYTCNFRHKVFRIPVDQWLRLKRLITRKNPGCAALFRSVDRDHVNTKILREIKAKGLTGA